MSPKEFERLVDSLRALNRKGLELTEFTVVAGDPFYGPGFAYGSGGYDDPEGVYSRNHPKGDGFLGEASSAVEAAEAMISHLAEDKAMRSSVAEQ